jgi:Asp-tRNA(Asn)/Glu-tRNA(Gln) amidotransferase A subunit family amidase
MHGQAGIPDRQMPFPPASDPFNALVARIDSTGKPDGPLAGLRFVAKDCLDLPGRAPGCGLSAVATAVPPEKPAFLIEHLLELGADLVGMAQMTALAYEPSGYNADLGRPINPRGPAFISGGSSSGSAVAVASGMADLAIGTDTAGSLRIPAHCCGVATWKPTNGLIDMAGVMPLAPSLDTLGFLAPSCAELARIAPFMGAVRQAPFSSLVLAADAVAASAPAIRDAIEACCAASALPIETVETLPLIRACDAPVFTLLQGEAYRSLRNRIESGLLDPTLAARLAKGASLGDDALDAARQELAAIATTMLEVVLPADSVLILPVMPCETPLVSACDPGSPDFSARGLYSLSAFTRFSNGLGLPVVAIPAGLDSNGMPVGVQLVARRGRDADLIALAAELAARLPKRTDAGLPQS